MKAFKGKFVKKDGTVREMIFSRLEDLPSEYVSSKIKGSGKTRKLPDGQELVIDLELEEFRIFNWDTVLEDPEEILIKD